MGARRNWNPRLETSSPRPRHKKQTVFHGPVIYTEDPYELITSAGLTNQLAEMLLPMFTKASEYQHQREYRFLIFTDHEPPEPYVDLLVSSCMPILMHACKDALQENRARPMVAPVETDECEQDETEGKRNAVVEEEPGISSISAGGVRFASRSVRPHERPYLSRGSISQRFRTACKFTTDDGQCPTGFESCGREGVGQASREVASAAFHAEPLLRGLCEAFWTQFEIST